MLKKHSDQFPNYLSGPSLRGRRWQDTQRKRFRGGRGEWRMKRRIEEEDE